MKLKKKFFFSNFLKLIFFKIINLIEFLIAIPLLILIYAFSPIKKIRFYKITANRLGHFAINTELYLCQKKLYQYKNCIDIFYLDGKPCNKFFLKLVKRHLLLFPNLVTNKLFFLNNFLSNYLNFCNNHEINIKCPDRDVENLFDKYSSQIELTSDEILNGEKYLNSIGIKKDKKFVLLYVRDSNYLNNQFPDKDWSKHEYRNYDIKYFKPAVLELIKKGFYVIRIGTDVKGHLEIDNKNYIDYSLSEQRSDFLDIFLCSRCHFCLSTASGFDTIPQIFRRPIASIFVPFYLVYSWSSKILVTTKNHFSIEKKRNLTLKELFEINQTKLLYSEQYAKNKIHLIHNSEEEILNFTKEAINIFHDQNFDLDQNIQKKFWFNFKELIKKQNLENYHGDTRSIMSESFLKSNPEWLQ